MRTIGQLCDEHRKKVSQGGKEPFYLTVVEPLLDEIEKSVDLKGSYELSGRFDVKAIAKFRKRDKISQALWIDYTGVLGIFRPKTTKCSGGLSGRGLQRGITFP
jgi:hypothetical protein